MAATSVLISVGVLTISFIVGVIGFYIINSQSPKEKKKSIEDVFSFIVNFNIFIWVGKVILNIQLFVKDPLAVLAYPSDSGAFYIAFIASILQLVWKMKKQHLDYHSFIVAFVTVFIFASFSYEFIELVWQDNFFNWRYLTLLFGLSVLLLMMANRMSYMLISGLILLIWGVGQAFLSVLLPFTSVFGYLIETWFFVLISLIGVMTLLYELKRK